MEKTIKLVATYSRVSTSKQEEEKTVENQLASLKKFSEENGYIIVREYTDEGWSGDTLIRPSLDNLRQDAKEKLWDAVLIYDPDRLARRYSYQELVMDELQEQGIKTLFVTVPPIKNENDQMLYELRGSFARYERTKIAERFRLGKLRKVRDGHLLVSQPLYGYRYIPKKDKAHGYYEIEESEARVVRMIFNWVVDEGLTMRKIVKRLQEENVKPRRSKKGVWNTSTLTHLFRNKGYIGKAKWGSSYAVVPVKPLKIQKYKKLKKTSRKIRPESEWYTVPIPPIIDEKLFLQVQRQLKANFELCPRNKKNQYLLSGKIRCSCGRSRCGEGPQHGKHLYYRCTDRVKTFPLPPNCHEKGINARIADDLVWAKVANLMSSPDLLREQIKRWMDSQHTRVESSVDDIDVIRSEIAKLKNEEDRYNKAYGSGLFTIDQLQLYTAPLRDKMTALEYQITKARQQERELEVIEFPNETEVEIFAEEAVEALKDLKFETKKAIVTNVIDRVIGTQDKLQVYGYIPITNHVEFISSYRNRRIAERGEVHSVQRAYEKKRPSRQLSFRHD